MKASWTTRLSSPVPILVSDWRWSSRTTAIGTSVLNPVLHEIATTGAKVMLGIFFRT